MRAALQVDDSWCVPRKCLSGRQQADNLGCMRR